MGYEYIKIKKLINGKIISFALAETRKGAERKHYLSTAKVSTLPENHLGIGFEYKQYDCCIIVAGQL